MHTYPIVLVTADNVDEAISAAGGFVEEACEDGAHDYGTVPAEEHPEQRKDCVLRAGTDAFRAALKAAREIELATCKEHWQALRSGMASLLNREEAPGMDELVTVSYEIGCGIQCLVKRGEKMQHEEPFNLLLWRAGKLKLLQSHIKYGESITNDAHVYDRREDKDKNPMELSENDNVFAVVLDLHY